MRNETLNKNKISVIGLGKLGLCFAACLAHRGFFVVGVDVNQRVIDSVNSGSSPIIEPGLSKLIAKYGGSKLKATTDHQKAINETDVTFILVATPSDLEGNFSNKYVESALKSLAAALKKSPKKYHLFVISSTVLPTSTEKEFIPIIERYSEKKINIDFGVCYNPVFSDVALGSVVKDFLKVDLVAIGENDKFAGDQVELIYRQLSENKLLHFGRMSIISAEIAKLAMNNYIVLKMSFANILANLCENIEGAELDLITSTLGADKKIAPYFFKGGLSFGGTCFPRDTKAFIIFSKKFGCNAKLIEAVEKINEFQNVHLAEIVFKNLLSIKKKKVSILGLSFKPNTPVIVESPAIKLIHRLLEKGIEITVYDPLAIDNTKSIFGDKIKYANSVRGCLSYSSCWIITTPDEEFKNIDDSFVTYIPTIIIDCWRILNSHKFSKKVKYIRWGYY